MTEKID